nr:MAG TPA: hypothetical protein [Caudoviricetes sp.]
MKIFILKNLKIHMMKVLITFKFFILTCSSTGWI